MVIKNYIHDCHLCGNPTGQSGDICQKCKGKSPVISGEICCICGIPLISENSVCMRCRKRNYAFERNFSIFEYKNRAREIFYHYKFAKHRDIAIWYCELINDLVAAEFHDYLIVPSPSRYYKKIRKGWDQIEYLCSILKGQYNLPVKKVLKRSGGSDQKRLDLEDRITNLKGKISVRRNFKSIKGQKILFLDDIFTTGATADECSRVLIEYGAASVTSLTIAID